MSTRTMSGTHARTPGVIRPSAPVSATAPLGADQPDAPASERELAELRSALDERERELEGLRARIAALEGTSEHPSPADSTPPAPDSSIGPIGEHTSRPMPASDTDTAELEAQFQYIEVTYRPGTVPPSVAPPMMRRNERLQCEMRIEFNEETHFYAGLTQDISQGGVFIATYHLRPVGMKLNLTFTMPDGVEIQTVGTVRWLRDGALEGSRPGMGVAFGELEPQALLSINRYCHARAPLYMDF